MSDTPPAAYVVDGDRVQPTDHARGPWFGDQQHGAALLGILTRFMERVPTAQPMRFTRITADLSRPVPMRPFTIRAEAVRDGRRVQSVQAAIEVDDRIVSRAFATRIRVDPGLVDAERIPPPRPDDEPPPFADVDTPYPLVDPGFHHCLQVRQLDPEDPLGGRTWLRLAGPLVEGEEPSPVLRLASIADMITSSAGRLGPGWISINPEVSLQIEREPEGEWFCMTSTVRFGDDGVGTSEGIVHDRIRRVGRASKSVLNMRRD